MNTDPHYDGREQSLVKHLILRRYLERFTYIIGSRWNSITYIDCFSGPWQSRSDEHADTSFAIAINEMRKARDGLKGRGIDLNLRCCFIEEDGAAFEKLCKFAESINDVEIKTHRGKLEDSIDVIVRFVGQSKRKTFPFVFVDPTGWTKFALDDIRPLLMLQPGEVLINFMTEHVRRFIDWPDEPNQQSFVRLFGDESFRPELSGLSGLDRDDACVEKYMKAVQQTGDFSFVSCALVLKSEADRSHFHLVYLTRDAKGVEVFKEAEKKSMKDMEDVRAKAQQKRRVSKSGQKELFSATESHDPTYFDGLRDRYCSRARRQLESLLCEQGMVTYDDAWAMALGMPLVWESDLKGWIQDWTKQGMACLEGLAIDKRAPKYGGGQRIVWK